jgi:hypothetical protein
MTTTFDLYKGKQSPNYTDFPKLNVEVLPDVRRCRECEGVAAYNPNLGSWGEYEHVDGDRGHRADPKLRCRFCHNEDGVRYVQYPWHDATECPRCEGSSGYAVGD